MKPGRLVWRSAASWAQLILLLDFCTNLMNLSKVSAQFSTSATSARSASTTLVALGAINKDKVENRHTSDKQQQQQQQQRNWHNSKLLAASQTASEQTSALVYLQKYGYMQAPANGAETNNLVSEESFSGAVSEFQRFAGLPQTGVADQQTLELMRLPRCGNSDKWRSSGQAQDGAQTSVISKSGQLPRRFVATDQAEVKRRRKRYALQGSKWRRQELTYRISQYPSRFSGKRHEVDAQISKAFSIWSQVAPIDFVVKKEGRVHIDIRFASGDHGDGDAFDGPGNTLAHAYFPQYGGDAHFDDQEYWTVDSYAGTNIFQVAAHELGHSLGLGHSNVREALMAPFYQKYKPHFKLHVDDVLAIQALYGEKPLDLIPPTSPPTSPPSTSSSSSSSPSSTPFTSTSTVGSTTSSRPTSSSRTPGIYKGGPRRPAPSTSTTGPLDEEWPPGRPEAGERDNHENNIPGAGTSNSGTGPFGSDSDLAGGPRSSHGPGAATPYPADLCSDGAIDAITRTEDGNTYVFKGLFYWLLVNEGIAKNYPRRISADWEGLPDNLDAALTWADGKTFFFKGNKYWRFKNKRRDVGYPKLISAGFAGVPDDLDAAFVWSGNGRTYFFKGSEYWRFDSKADPPVSAEYPRSTKVWLGVPAHINAAFKWENNVTYFFKGNQYYRFNDKEFRVEARGRPAFPRQTSEWWFGCVNSNLAQRAFSGSLRHHHHHSAPSETMAPSSPQAIKVSTGANGQLQSQQTTSGDDWSFLAGLSEDSTRPLGTHISDHKPPPLAARTNEVESSQLDELSPAWLADGQVEPRTDEPVTMSKRSGWLPPPPPPPAPSTGNNPFRLGGFFNPLHEGEPQRGAFPTPTSTAVASSFLSSSASSSSSSSTAILNPSQLISIGFLTAISAALVLQHRRQTMSLVN